MALEIIRLGPDDLAREQCSLASDTSGLAFSLFEAALLQPDHPFLRYGSWCAFFATRCGRPVARLVASVDLRQCAGGRPVGAIGFPADVDDPEALSQALYAAVGWLRQIGTPVVRCPIQLSTWFGHRAVTRGFQDEDGAPTFLLEPSNPRRLVEVLQRSGFVVAHRAVSHLIDNDLAIAGTQHGLDRMRAAGYRDRSLNLAALEGELALLHQLASAIFRDNWGYADISPAEFAAFYKPFAQLVDPELVRIAENADGEAVGFVLAIPAGAGRQRADGPASGTPAHSAATGFLLKSIGIIPETRRRCPKLGSALVAIVHSLAQRRGYGYGIHALMAEGSYAQRTSARWGSTLRSYATFERTVDER